MAEMTLLEFLRSLIFNDEAREDFAENPEKALDDAGLGHLSADDVHDAILLMQEDNQDADFSRDYNTGGNDIHIAAPAPVHHHDGGSDSAAEYINHYITNNYVTDNDVITDNSINQQIDTGGGDFDQDIDIDSTVAAGEGAVAAGGDIENSNVVTGDDNVIGDGNVSGDGNLVGDDNQAVLGNGNTTSFGDGDATSTEIDGDVSVDDGGAFAIGGNASVDNTDNSVEDSFNDNSDNSVSDSFNDNSEFTDNTDNSVEDSFNDNSETTSDSHNDVEHNRDVDINA